MPAHTHASNLHQFPTRAPDMIKLRRQFNKLLRGMNLRGYYAESKLALRTLPRRELPVPRFIIYGLGRSGSRLLCELLGSHSQIHCDFEILAYPVRDVHRYLQRSALAATRPAYGFKVKLEHLAKQQRIDDVGAFLHRMHEDGWYIVYLMRRNLFRGAYSNLARVAQGKSHTRPLPDGSAPPPPRVRVDIERIVDQMRWRQKVLHREQLTLEGLSYKTLVYEDDLYQPSDQQRAVGELVEWLGLTPEPVYSNVIRSTPRNLQQVITNFEELETGLRGTQFEADFREAVGS